MRSGCDCGLLSFISSGTLLGVKASPVICRFCWKKWAVPYPYGCQNIVVSVERVDLLYKGLYKGTTLSPVAGTGACTCEGLGGWRNAYGGTCIVCVCKILAG